MPAISARRANGRRQAARYRQGEADRRAREALHELRLVPDARYHAMRDWELAYGVEDTDDILEELQR